jgi:hypothetical protein
MACQRIAHISKAFHTEIELAVLASYTTVGHSLAFHTDPLAYDGSPRSGPVEQPFVIGLVRGGVRAGAVGAESQVAKETPEIVSVIR